MDKYQEACTLNRPCDCNAPIAFTGVVDNDGTVATTLYGIDSDLITTTLYESGHNRKDMDDLNLICIKCGASWVSFNPLFD